MNTIARRLALVGVIVLALCRAAYADQFTVTGGSITVIHAHSGAVFTLTGDGFSLSGGVLQFITGCFPCGPAQPSITIGGSLSDSVFGGGPGTIAGVDYPQVLMTGLMQVGAQSFPESMLLESTTITVPFDFSAILTGYPSIPDAINGTRAIFRGGNFSGSGTATLNFNAGPVNPDGSQLFNFASGTFAFMPSAPTPEPATVALLAMGAATVFALKRKH